MINRKIYNLVNQIIKRFHSREPEEVLKGLGIKLLVIGETRNLLGMYKIIERNRFIFLPRNVGGLKRVVLAHEIGHDQLHRKYCLEGATFQENKIFNPTTKYEMEANIFAAHLLIADEEIYALMREDKTEFELLEELGVDINLLNLKISEMAKMKLLPFEEMFSIRPESTFLKKYKPLDDG